MINEEYREFYIRECQSFSVNHELPTTVIIAEREKEWIEEIPFDRAIQESPEILMFPSKETYGKVCKWLDKVEFSGFCPLHLIKKWIDALIDRKLNTRKRNWFIKQGLIVNWEGRLL